jgi:hypothetical protein
MPPQMSQPGDWIAPLLRDYGTKCVNTTLVMERGQPMPVFSLSTLTACGRRRLGAEVGPDRRGWGVIAEVEG